MERVLLTLLLTLLCTSRGPLSRAQLSDISHALVVAGQVRVELDGGTDVEDLDSVEILSSSGQGCELNVRITLWPSTTPRPPTSRAKLSSVEGEAVEGGNELALIVFE